MNRVAMGYTPGASAVRGQSTVTKLDFLKTKIVFKLLVIGVLAVIMALFYIWSRVQIVQIGYEINHLKQQQQVLVDQNKKLKMELMVLKSPEVLHQLAEKELNLKVPNNNQIVNLK